MPLIKTILDAVVTLNQFDGVRGEELFGAAAAAGFAAHGAEAVAAAQGGGFGFHGAVLAGGEEEERAEGGEVGGDEDRIRFDSGGRGVSIGPEIEIGLE